MRSTRTSPSEASGIVGSMGGSSSEVSGIVKSDTHLYRFPFRQVVIVGESQILGVLEVVVSDAVVIIKLVVFEELEAAVDHRRVSVCRECGTR